MQISLFIFCRSDALVSECLFRKPLNREQHVAGRINKICISDQEVMKKDCGLQIYKLSMIQIETYFSYKIL